MGSTTIPARRKRSALIAAAVLAAATIGAVAAEPASGSIGPAGLRTNRLIRVVHNLDYVAVGGYVQLGRQITVRVVRNGVTIGSATGNTTHIAEGGAGLEINHGIEGTFLRPGDCWDEHTPDIRPGDHIVVTDSAGRDEVVVDDIRFTGPPAQEAGTGDVLVPFRAVDARGAAIPAGRLDAAAFRDDQLRYRAADIALEPVADGAPGEYQMRYRAPFAPTRAADDSPDPEDPPLTQDDIARSLLGEGHTVGFEAALSGGEGMVVEGVSDTPGPAVGCEAAPNVPNGVSAVTPGVVNQGNANDPMVVAGFSEDASEVEVELSDGDSVVTAPAELSAATGQQTWRASVPATELAGLSGNIRVTATVDGTPSFTWRTALIDTEAPVPPTVSLPAGAYRGAQGVTIDSDPTDRVRYTLGDGLQPDPSAGRGQWYQGGEIRVAATQTLKVVSIDEVDNVSSVVTRRYRILKAPSAPAIGRATPGDRGGRTTARATWDAPATDNGGRVTGYRVTALRLRADDSVASHRAFPVDRRAARALQMRLPAGRYAFRVQAVNAFGTSAMSTRSNVTVAR
jgi:hypothetical protein